MSGRAGSRAVLFGWSLIAVWGCKTSVSVGTTPPAPSEASPRAESDPQVGPAPSKVVDLSGPLERIRQAHGAPALGAAVVDARGVVAIGAAGRRRVDEAEPIHVDDPFHLGSDTKAITAFAAARLVARDELGWDFTVAEAFADFADGIAPRLRGVTLEQLLMHRGGLPPDVDSSQLPGVQPNTGVAGLRRGLARVALGSGPASAVGEFSYSNAGYIVAGAMMEAKTDLAWEAIVQREVFDPLGMTSCGFGPTARGTQREHPWAHERRDGQYVPTEIDNPAFFGPAGTVHCSLSDWGRFAVEQFNEDEDALLPAEILRRLHQGRPMPDGRGEYAMGWIVTTSPLTSGPLWTHDGSNTVNYASVLVIPERGLAVVAAANAGDGPAQKAVVSAVAGLLQTYGGGG